MTITTMGLQIFKCLSTIPVRVTVDLGLRMYYETKPKEFEDGTPPGYNSWSIRQDTLLGLTYIW